MKKFVDPIPDGGAPLSATEVVSLANNEIWDVLDNTLGGLGIPTQFSASSNAVIISGCVRIAGAGTHELTAGIIYFPQARQFVRTVGFSDTAGDVFIEPAASSTIIQKTFQDSGVKDLLTFVDETQNGAAIGSDFAQFTPTQTTARIETIFAQLGDIQDLVFDINNIGESQITNDIAAAYDIQTDLGDDYDNWIRPGLFMIAQGAGTGNRPVATTELIGLNVYRNGNNIGQVSSRLIGASQQIRGRTSTDGGSVWTVWVLIGENN